MPARLTKFPAEIETRLDAAVLRGASVIAKSKKKGKRTAKADNTWAIGECIWGYICSEEGEKERQKRSPI